MQTRKYLISGRVQGVWFRDSTRREAERLDLRGYARNLASGDVEVMASGQIEALDQLAAWLQEGPPLARVSHVTSDIVEFRRFEGFGVE